MEEEPRQTSVAFPPGEDAGPWHVRSRLPWVRVSGAAEAARGRWLGCAPPRLPSPEGRNKVAWEDQHVILGQAGGWATSDVVRICRVRGRTRPLGCGSSQPEMRHLKRPISLRWPEKEHGGMS